MVDENSREAAKECSPRRKPWAGRRPNLPGVVKTNSSRWVREKWSPNFGWQTGYGVFSVSESNVTAVRKYIANQEEHHKKHSFQDEFRAFLKKNGIAVDEKYIWG